jgi:RimJ/RimL family protein N-acetyltransferase
MQLQSEPACPLFLNPAHAPPGRTTFVVSIRPDNAASLSLAAQLGFVKIGHHIDEVDGWEDIFELRRQRKPA